MRRIVSLDYLEYVREIPLLSHSAKGWEHVKGLWVQRLLDWFAGWAEAGQPGKVWPRLETINREIKFLVLEHIAETQRLALAPVLRAWFPHEIRDVRTAINRTLQALGKGGLPHPKRQKKPRV